MNFFGFRNKSRKNLSDEELIEHYRNQADPEVFSELFSRYTPLVYGVCLKYLEDREDAKDAVMQIFTKLLEQLRSEKPEKFKPWLYTVAKNYCLMELRKKKNEPFMPHIHDIFMENPYDVHPDTKMLQMEKLLTEAQNTLPEAQKQCIELFYLQEKSYKEISSLTGYATGEVKSHIQNGKRNLKIRLEKGGVHESE